MKAVIGHAALDPIENYLGELFRRTHILSEDLKLLAVHINKTTGVPFERAHPLRRPTQREVLEWSGENWPTLGEAITAIAANRRRVGHSIRLGDQKVRK
jgi:hypothetical protein